MYLATADTPTAASTQRQGRSHKISLHEALWRHSLNEAPYSSWNGVAHIGNSRPSLGNPATGAAEQLVALKFLLHFVGDLHQPLHAADDHDAGGCESATYRDPMPIPPKCLILDMKRTLWWGLNRRRSEPHTRAKLSC